MVAVQPLSLLRSQHIRQDRRRVDRCKGERLEPEELAERCCRSGNDEQGVLDAHAELPLEIDPRLVGDGHPRPERRRPPLHANLVRTFMHIQITSNPMSRTVQVVIPLAPHRFAGDGIDLRAARPGGETAQGKLDVSLQHQGVNAPLLLCQPAQGNGPCDVCRTVFVLCPAVNEHQPVRLYGGVCRRGRLVMHDGTVRLVTHDGVEGDAFEKRLFGTQCRQPSVERHLRLSAGLNGRLQPGQEFHHRNAVAQHGGTEAVLLHPVLDGLHPGDRRLAEDGLAPLQGRDQCVVRGGVVDEQVSPGVMFQSHGNRSVGFYRNIPGCKTVPHLLREFLLIYI